LTISKAKTFRNILYSCLTRGAASICQLVAASVVARNLTPADYGVVGFAGIIIGFLSRFGDLGIGTAVIRRPQIDQKSLSTAFTLKIILSAVAFAVAFAIAPFAHHFFEHPATGNVIRFLALDFLVGTIGFLSLVTLMREMNYRALVIPSVVSAVVRVSLIILLIVRGWRFWGIIVADVCATLANGIVVQIIKTVPLRLRFDWPDAEEYLRFGIPLFGSGVVIFIIFNLDNFLVGTSMGSVKLGYYALAFTWASFLCGLLNDTVNNVLLPTLSAIQNDPVAMRRWYLKTIDLVAFVAVVANTSLLVNSHFFLVTFLGKGSDKWIPAATALEILCVYGILRSVTESAGPILMARGATKTLWHANLLGGVVEVVLLLLALRSGKIEMVAAAVLLAYACAGASLLPFLRREFSIGLGDIAGRIWPLGPAAALGYVVASLLPASFGSTITTLAGRGLITASAVALTHGLCTRFRCFQEAGGMISGNFARVRA
jgi:O-antigen/teichoic acid export membrane protein